MSKNNQEEKQAPQYVLDVFESLVATVPGLERKGKTMPYVALNGNMFAFITSGGELAVRLSKGEREEFLSKHKNAEVIQHGALMKEYVAAPADMAGNEEEIGKLFARSYEYARTLKPKPTKKPK